MKQFYFRLKNALMVGWWAFKYKEVMYANNFKMLSNLLKLITDVSVEHRHKMAHIAFVHPEEGGKEVVSIWAGAGINAKPTKRIKELVKENNTLKKEISELVRLKPPR